MTIESFGFRIASYFERELAKKAPYGGLPG